MKKSVLQIAVVLLFGSNGLAQNRFPDNGNVGIGTTSPGSALHVGNGWITVDSTGGNYNEGLRLNAATNGYATIALGGTPGSVEGQPAWSISSTGGVNYFDIRGSGISRFSLLPNGNAGIGTTNPAEKLEVNGNIRMNGSLIIPSGANGIQINNTGTRGNVIQADFPNLGLGESASASFGYKFGGSNLYDSGIVGYTYAGGEGSSQNYMQMTVYGAPTSGLVVNGAGNVGVGTTSPNAKLDIAGNVKIAANNPNQNALDINGNVKLSGSGAHLIFPDGSTQSVPWNGTTCGGDYAESVDVAGDRMSYEPGDVLVLAASEADDVEKSQESYSTRVAGIYSTKPGLTGRRQAGDAKTSTTEVPMAMVGIVPTKVSTENGPIHRGDLLVTSSRPGYAMKGTDRSKMLGAVVGKAMGHLDKDTGVIEVLVTLQ